MNNGDLLVLVIFRCATVDFNQDISLAFVLQVVALFAASYESMLEKSHPRYLVSLSIRFLAMEYPQCLVWLLSYSPLLQDNSGKHMNPLLSSTSLARFIFRGWLDLNHITGNIIIHKKLE